MTRVYKPYYLRAKDVLKGNYRISGNHIGRKNEGALVVHIINAGEWVPASSHIRV